MTKILVVVDMQNDFINGTLGTKEAVSIVEKVINKVKSFSGKVIFTRDTHGENYLQTDEGKNLPISHCLKGSDGWQLQHDLAEICHERKYLIIDKPTFGSRELGEYLSKLNIEESVEAIELVGLCTDICVISNALLIKAFLPNTPIKVDVQCCAGVTPLSHDNAVAAMKVCQIDCY